MTSQTPTPRTSTASRKRITHGRTRNAKRAQHVNEWLPPRPRAWSSCGFMGRCLSPFAKRPAQRPRELDSLRSVRVGGELLLEQLALVRGQVTTNVVVDQ